MKLNREEISARLKEILIAADEKYRAKVNDIDFNSSLATDMGLTSVGMLYLVIVIEESFSIRFENVGMDDFKTFGDIVNYIESKQK
ncbi:MAG: acyl carrier protein [Treponema sp.]|nr:acyl carrier protein [Treponema sp.]MBQ2601098.1 acyl carrier protein [Treponema sp.]